MSEDNVVVIDAGSGLVKAGLAGDDAPTAVYPTLIGKPKQESAMSGVDPEAYCFGQEAAVRRGVLDVHHPIERGIVTDWAAMEMMWEHTFSQILRLEPSSQSVLLTECPLIPRSGREKTMEIMFEKFSTQALYIQQTAVSSLYASGRTTGLVLESGEGVTHAVPVYEGFALKDKVQKLDVSGLDVDQFLKELLKTEDVRLWELGKYGVFQDIKEKLCYVADDYELECQRPLEDIQVVYTLPDGDTFTVGRARFQAAEAMFDPRKMFGLEAEAGGVCGLVAGCVERSQLDMRNVFARNIVLAGGNTMTTNFAERFAKELKGKLSSEVQVHAPPERKYSAWIGSAMLGSLSSFSSMAITKDEYDEEGAAAVHRKCL